MDGLDPVLDQVIPAGALVLARRFAAGATMWCVAPRWPEHARHLAVEFVHPVIVGTRALPAVAVPGSDPVSALRSVVLAGDVIAVLSRADDASAADLLRRAEAWGCTTLWLATGPGGDDVRADVTVRVDDPDGTAPYDGRLVLRYHLLWELTHVGFEHPGLLTPPEGPDACDVDCITCGDEGRLAEVIVAADDRKDVEVRTAEGREHVDATLVDELAPDDLVLVHAGSVIAKVGGP